MIALRLKLGTHMDSGLLHHMYQNQGPGPMTLGVTSLNRSYNLPLMKKICPTFLKNCTGNKVETWYTQVQWFDVSCIPK